MMVKGFYNGLGAFESYTLMNWFKKLCLIFIFFLSQQVSAVNCTGVPVWTSGGQSCNAIRQYGGRLYQNACSNGWDGAGDNPAVNGDWTDLGACGNEPVVTTNAASGISANSATFNGTVTSNSGFALTDRGFIYGTNSASVDAATVGSPGGATVVSEGGTAVSSYNETISGLCRNVTYYYKSYATNSDGTGYGSRVSFTTSNTSSITTSQNGAWTTNATWGGCTAPSTTSARAGDNINIAHNVTVSALDIDNTNVITVKSGGVLTITGTLDMGWTSTLIVEAGGTLIVNTVDYSSGSSNITNSGTFTVTNSFTLDVNGDFTSTGTFSVTNNVSLTSSGDMTLSGTNTIGGSVNATGSGTNFDVVGGTLDVTGSMVLDGDATHSMNGDISVGGDWSITGSATASVGGNVDVTGTMNVLNDGVVSGTGVITWGNSNTNPSCSPARVVCQDGTQLDDLPDGACPQTKGDLPSDGIDLSTCTAVGGLPVELINFKVLWNGDEAEISWGTLTEFNNDHFTVERSREGKNWEVLIYVPGAGFSFDPKSYSVTDFEPSDEGGYYRLKQTDFDGTSTYSNVIFIHKKDTKPEFSIQPNPTKGKIQVNFLKDQIPSILEVVSLQGQTIYRNETLSNEIISIDLSTVPRGMYSLKLQYTDTVLVEWIIVE